ncbi:MAG: hypothetical protein ACREOE_18825, partial [Gemmatimonadales bacterium]
MKRSFLALAALVVALPSCRPDRPKLPDLPAAFSTLPLPPDAEFISRTGSADALMLTFRTPLIADSAASYYRKLFHADTSYHVFGDTKGDSGEHAYYVEIATRPLWVRIRPDASAGGSVVELTGAVVARPDSTPPPAAK